MIQPKIPRFLFEAFDELINLNEKNVIVCKTTNSFNLGQNSEIDIIVNLEQVNNIRRINKFHENVNNLIVDNGLYISCAETGIQRNYRLRRKHFILLSPFFTFIDFIYKRVIPKMPIIKKLYFAITRGHNRVMSETEILGRLVSCGFSIYKTINHDGLTYILSHKVREPYYDMNPSYGPIFKMKRIGYNGKIISVYKFRTMSPYSEYIQKRITDNNKLSDSGKIRNDYRITVYGKFLRKYWIDEFPMIINWFKRELKIVGVRPLSKDYFSRYPDDLKKLRIKTKPGLIPPYYVDLPVSFDEICDSERNYLNKFFKNPIKTDLIYFFSAFWNIFIRRKRSN